MTTTTANNLPSASSSLTVGDSTNNNNNNNNNNNSTAAQQESSAASPSSSSSSSIFQWKNEEWRPFMFLPALIVSGLAVTMLIASLELFYIQKVCLSHYSTHGDHSSSSILALQSAKGAGNDTTPIRCDTPDIQEDIATFRAALVSAAIIPSLFTSVIVGYLSDRIGRKPLMTLAMLALFVDIWSPYLVAAFNLPIGFFFVGKLLLGVCGGFAGVGSVGFAMLVDITTTENRTRVISIYNGCIVLVSLVGITIGGLITGNPPIGHMEAFLPVFKIAAVLASIGNLFIIFGTPETLKVKMPFFKKEDLVGGPTQKPFLTLMYEQAVTFIAPFKNLPMSIVLTQFLIAAAAFRTTYEAQLANYRFGWGTKEMSWYGIFETLSSGFLVAFLLPIMESRLRRYFNKKEGLLVPDAAAASSASTTATAAAAAASLSRGDSDATLEEATPLLAETATTKPLIEVKEDDIVKRRITIKVHMYLVRFTFFGSIIGALIFALAQQGWIWFAAFPLLSLAGLSALCLRLIVSEYVAPNQLALVNSVIGLVDSVILLISVQVAAQVYPHIFFLSAAIFASCFIAVSFSTFKAPPTFSDVSTSTATTTTTTEPSVPSSREE